MKRKKNVSFKYLKKLEDDFLKVIKTTNASLQACSVSAVVPAARAARERTACRAAKPPESIQGPSTHAR